MTSLGDMFPSHTGMMPVPPALFVPVGKKGPDTKMYPCPIPIHFLVQTVLPQEVRQNETHRFPSIVLEE